MVLRFPTTRHGFTNWGAHAKCSKRALWHGDKGPPSTQKNLITFFFNWAHIHKAIKHAVTFCYHVQLCDAKKLFDLGGPLNLGTPCHGIIGIMVHPALPTTKIWINPQTQYIPAARGWR